MGKYAVIKHRPDGTTWTAEVLPSEAEAQAWAEIFRERGEPDVTYTVEPLACAREKLPENVQVAALEAAREAVHRMELSGAALLTSPQARDEVVADIAQQLRIFWAEGEGVGIKETAEIFMPD